MAGIVKQLKTRGGDAVRRILSRLTRSMEPTRGFEYLEEAPPSQICHFIQNEHPQTIALILTHFRPARIAHCLELLPEALAADVAIRIAGLDEIPPEITREVSNALNERISALYSTHR